MKLDSFSESVCEKLEYYVYRLIDPRNAETFYIGKGKGNRLFAHVNDELSSTELEDDQDSVSEKINRIRQIRNDGFQVLHVIHRHGMEERTAFEVEAALIDATAGVSNLAGGHGSNDRGPMRAEQVIQLYDAPVAEFEHKVVLINVNISRDERDLYQSVRYAWRLSADRARHAEYVLATSRGMIIGAFVADEWFEATEENFPGLPAVEGRWGFVGRKAPPEIQDRYVGKRVPSDYSKKGASNPVKYSF
jgi:hypothetical protein